MKRFISILLLVVGISLGVNSSVASAAAYRLPMTQVTNQQVLVMKERGLGGYYMLVPVRRFNSVGAVVLSPPPQVWVVP